MVLRVIVDVAVALRSELLIFSLAILIFVLNFGHIPKPGKAASPTSSSQKCLRSDKPRAAVRKHDAAIRAEAPPCCKGRYDKQQQAVDELQHAHCSNDARGVLRCWNSIKNENIKLEPGHLCLVVQSMQRLRIDGGSIAIARNIEAYLKQHASSLGNLDYINELLESVAKSLDTVLVDGIILCLTDLSLKPNGKTFEILVLIHSGTRSHKMVAELYRQMEAQGIQPTSRTSLALLKTALHSQNLTDAMHHYKSFRIASRAPIPAHVEVQLVELASREHRIEVVLTEIERGEMPCSADVLNTFLIISQSNESPRIPTQTKERIYHVAAQEQSSKNAKTYELLICMAAGDRDKMMKLFEELLSLGRADCVRDVASSLLKVLDPENDVRFADKLFEIVCQDSHTQMSTFCALVRFYSDAGSASRACHVYSNHLRPEASEKIRLSPMDWKTQQSIINAALACGRDDIIIEIINTSLPTAKARCVETIARRIAKGDIELSEELKSAAEMWR